jgi:hypothetical protein
VAGFAAGPLLTAVHLYVVPHTTCVEDGELVETDRPSAVPTALPPGIQESPASTPDGSGRVHHCEAAPSRTAPTQQASGLALAAHDLSGLLPLARAEDTRPLTGVPLLHLAPKASPPVQG